MKAVPGIVLGVVAWFAVVFAVSFAIRAGDPSLSAELLAHTTPIAMIERLVISFIASLAAGYIAALLSGESRGAPLIAGVLLLVIFVPYHLYDRDAQGTIWTSFPLWNHLTFFVSLPLLSVIGRRLWH